MSLNPKFYDFFLPFALTMIFGDMALKESDIKKTAVVPDNKIVVLAENAKLGAVSSCAHQGKSSQQLQGYFDQLVRDATGNPEAKNPDHALTSEECFEIIQERGESKVSAVSAPSGP